MIAREVLIDLYENKKWSMQDIATHLGCSLHTVDYWMKRHAVIKRSRSDALYIRNNPSGDPFCYNPPKTSYEYWLEGIGIGLYWGEGTKANIHSVRLGNTDPRLIMTFIEFLETIYSINRDKLKFSLQIFSDMDEETTRKYWAEKLSVKLSQFTKSTVTISGKVGTYRRKSRYGVLTLNFHNVKLRNELVSKVPR